MTDDRITTETDGEQYGDIRVDGNVAASVELREDDDGPDEVAIRAVDPNHPEEAVEIFHFALQNDD